MPTLQWTDTLTQHLRNVGYSPVTGQVALPQAWPAETIHGHGGLTFLTDDTSEKRAQ